MIRNVFTRALHVTLLTIAAASLLVGCIPAGAGSDSPANQDDGGTSGSTASENLRNMPEPGVALPASLAAGGDSASNNTIRALATGDITEVSVRTIPDVKANGWYEMNQKTEVSQMLTLFLNEVREIASERELEFDTVYALGERDFWDGSYDMGTMKLTGTSADDFTVWWYPKPFAAWDTYIQLDILRTGDDWRVEMLSTIIQGPDHPFGEEGTTFDYAFYDTATGESSISYAFEPVDGSTGTRDYARATPRGDGSITFVSRGQYAYQDGSVTTEAVAGWGDDTQGGVIATYNDDGREMAMKEFYNQNGGLIQQAWGESSLDTEWLSWIDSTTSQNLADLSFDPALPGAPNGVSLFYFWNETDSSTEIWASIDGDFSDNDNVQLSGDVWNVYYRAGSDWTAGDTVYNWNGDESLTVDLNGGESVTGWRVSYTKGYQVPEAEAVFGGSYYFRNQFPLKTLLPLADSYEGKTVLREEGDTFTSEDGSDSWTDYTYFIDVNDNDVLDQGGENDDIRLDNVWLNENWTWNPETDEIAVVRAPFFSTTGTNLPSYFTAPDQTTIATIETEIDDAYSEGIAEISLDDLPIQDISEFPQFDDMRD